MTIEARCSSCDRLLRAPDSAAGRTARCPNCGEAVTMPDPQAQTYDVYETEEIDEDHDWENDFVDDTPARRQPAPSGYGAPPPGAANGEREPCPVCGELIIRGARVCRFCGEAFDKSLARNLASGGRGFDKIERFRKEMNGLGGLWIFLAVMSFGGIAIMANGLPGRRLPPEVAVIAAAFGVVLLIAGICTCTKQMWAVYVGLAISYLLLIGSVLSLVNGNGGGGCVFIFWIISVMQGHRVISWANEMTAAGIPLDSRG